MTASAKSSSTLVVALALFGLGGSMVAVTVPNLFTGPERPAFTVFLIAGVAVITLTAGLFAYIARLGMGFGKTALVLAAGYNALIAAVKLGLAPAALYTANQRQDFDSTFGDPNNPWFYIAVGAAVMFVYVGVFRVMYGVFNRRFRIRAGGTIARQERRSLWSGVRRRPVLIALVIASVALLASLLWIMPLLFVGMPTLSYLIYVFSTFGAAITLALILAAVLAYKTFAHIEDRAVHLKDATLLANFFWLGLALILLYHAMWVVFLLTLVSIWPFRTYTPK
jgi:hypothetical protein